jgi:EmrB/QacA subfamily drug resistance transporter
MRMTTVSAAHERGAARWLRLGLVGLGISIVPLDSSVNIAFPDITTSFGLPIAMIQWVVVSYVLTYAGLILAFGRIGDIWSYGLVFRAGLAWSVAAFLLCAAAPSYGWLLVFRVLQGIGAGLVISCAPALVTSLYPEARRAHALGAFSLMLALGSMVGPLLGGLLVQRWGWPAVFWFRAPIALTSLVLLRGLPAASGGKGESLDVVGAALLALALAMLLFGINAARYLGAGNYLAVPLVALALASFAGFVGWERRVARPIVRPDLFRLPGFALVNFANLLVNLASFSIMLFTPYYLARFTGLPLAVGGVVLAGGAIGMALASPVAGRLLTRLTPQQIAPVGALLAGTGLFLVGGWQPGIAAPMMLADLALQGIGTGFFQVAYMEIVMGALPPQHRGVAGSLSMLTRTIGTVTGATALTLVFYTIEDASKAGGRDDAEAFLAAYAMTFHLAGIAAGIIGVLIALTGRARR